MFPSLEKLNTDRLRGRRPEVVVCLINNNQVLMLFNREYHLWQFPQGGIENLETLTDAFNREMSEELGSAFLNSVDKNPTCFLERSLSFPSNARESRDLVTDAGEKLSMRGKKYYFVYNPAPKTKLVLKETEFDEASWLSYSEAVKRCRKIYQLGKRRVTLAAVEKLHELGILLDPESSSG